jgi:hypothetical protein
VTFIYFLFCVFLLLFFRQCECSCDVHIFCTKISQSISNFTHLTLQERARRHDQRPLCTKHENLTINMRLRTFYLHYRKVQLERTEKQLNEQDATINDLRVKLHEAEQKSGACSLM